MTVEAMQLFTSLLALAALAGAVAAVAVRLLAGPLPALRPSAAAVGEAGLWVAFAVALGATLGSLYFSEVADYVPCRLCWFQRIAMYPLTVITLVGALRRDRGVRFTVLPIAVIGAAVSAWHLAVEWRPGLEGTSCSATGPRCADFWFRELGFVTLAFMALAGFLAIIAFTVLATGRPVPGTKEQTS